MNNNLTTSTPWGHSQHAKHIGEGIIQHSCAGHGGLFVPRYKLAEMPAALRCNCYAGGGSWFEEDCEWALVALAFPHLFTPYNVWAAGKTVMGSSDTYKQAADWLKSEAGESVAALVTDFEAAHAKDYHWDNMNTAGKGWLVSARTLDGSERIRFTIDDYAKLPTPFTKLEAIAAGAEFQPVAA